MNHISECKELNHRNKYNTLKFSQIFFCKLQIACSMILIFFPLCVALIYNVLKLILQKYKVNILVELQA